MAYEDKVIDITAEELEIAIKYDVPNLREKMLYQEDIPVSFDATLENNICKVNCLFAGGGSQKLELDLGLNKSASFGDLTGATKFEVAYVRLEDSKVIELEKYQSGGSIPPFRDIYIPVALYWTKDNEIVGFCGYEQEEVYSELKKDLEAKADKESWKLIETITCDGTKATYKKSGLNLSALKVVCSTEVGEKAFNGRLNINNITFAFFSNYISTSKKHMFATVDLNNSSTQKGIGTAFTEVIATENLEIVDYMLSMESITSYDFGSYLGTQFIPSGSVIKIYGKE